MGSYQGVKLGPSSAMEFFTLWLLLAMSATGREGTSIWSEDSPANAVTCDKWRELRALLPNPEAVLALGSSATANKTSSGSVAEIQVNCGEHFAPTCEKCPKGSGYVNDWCNGDCMLRDRKCTEKDEENANTKTIVNGLKTLSSALNTVEQLACAANKSNMSPPTRLVVNTECHPIGGQMTCREEAVLELVAREPPTAGECVSCIFASCISCVVQCWTWWHCLTGCCYNCFNEVCPLCCDFS